MANVSGNCREFGDESVEEFYGGGAGGGEPGFQLIHQGNQLIHFSNDTALFYKRRDKNDERLSVWQSQ